MIVRILGDNQYQLAESHLEQLNVLDGELEAALAGDDDEAFRTVLGRMAGLVRTEGTPEPDEFLGASDVTLPDADATREDVVAMLAEDGLVPG